MKKHIPSVIILILFIILIGVLLNKYAPEKKIELREEEISKSEQKKPIIDQKQADSLATINEHNEILAQLNGNLLQLKKKNSSISTYQTEQIRNRINWYKKMTEKSYLSGSNHKDFDKLIKEILRETKKVQTKEFPLLRRAFYKELKETVWEHDIYVDLSGNNSNVLTMTSYIFSSNGNKKNYYEEMQEVLKMLRFKSIRFKWYKGASEYTYYELEPLKDSYLE